MRSALAAYSVFSIPLNTVAGLVGFEPTTYSWLRQVLGGSAATICRAIHNALHRAQSTMDLRHRPNGTIKASNLKHCSDHECALTDETGPGRARRRGSDAFQNLVRKAVYEDFTFILGLHVSELHFVFLKLPGANNHDSRDLLAVTVLELSP
jgi:hypothetical protein